MLMTDTENKLREILDRVAKEYKKKGITDYCNKTE